MFIFSIDKITNKVYVIFFLNTWYVLYQVKDSGSNHVVRLTTEIETTWRSYRHYCCVVAAAQVKTVVLTE